MVRLGNLYTGSTTLLFQLEKELCSGFRAEKEILAQAMSKKMIMQAEMFGVPGRVFLKSFFF